MEFIGRDKELRELNSRYRGKKKEFGVIYGRRRAGKTALISEFAKGKNAVVFQAKRDSAYGNLRSFSYAICQKLSLPSDFVFSSYEAAFRAIEEHFAGERYLLVIDEYPYILDQMPSFSSVLQEFVDKSEDNLFLLISGSDVSFLKNEILDHNSPLYKRRTLEMKIGKLDYSEAIAFVKDFDDEEKSRYLSLMSTFPYYLSAIDPSLSFEENLKRLLFNPYGAFFGLPDQVLSNSVRAQDVYNAILLAISHKHKNVSSISNYTKEEDAKISKYLTTLINGETVRRAETFWGNKKTVYYEIDDPLLEFYYRFIFRNEERIRMNGKMVYDELHEQIEQFISFGFENICRLYLEQKNKNGELGMIYPSIKPYRVENSKLGRSIEIDGLAENGDSLLVIECKYRNRSFDKAMLLHLQESVSVFPEEMKRTYYIFSKAGFSNDVLSLKDENLHLIDFTMLFEDK